MPAPGKSQLFDALSRWLPYPVYEFRGGPIDGQHRKVSLVEMTDGMHAPEFWNVQVPTVHFELGPTLKSPQYLAVVEGVATIATYRFVPCTINTGYYEHVS